MTESATIMVVEDEQLFAKELKDRLETYGYTVPAHVSTGEAAIQMAEFRHPDLIIMDIMLKGKLDGIETADIYINFLIYLWFISQHILTIQH